VTSLRAIVERHLRAFNERDFDAWDDLLDEDVEVVVDSAPFHGRAGARAYATGVVTAYPGVRARLERVVAETDDTIVVEYRLENSEGGAGEQRLPVEGAVCEVFRVHDGRVVELRSYYGGLGQLAREQAALRRVATLVAREAPPDDVFAAVAAEVEQLLGVGHALLYRYETDGNATLLAESGDIPIGYAIGERIPLDGDSVTARVLSTERPARMDDYSHADGELGSRVYALGIGSAVGAPIVVTGRLWGVLMVASKETEPLPATVEERIASFTDLVATAIANIQARTDLAESRARVVAAADEERRRVVRDLHDGAQQRLVHTVITLKLAERAIDPAQTDAVQLVGDALREAQRANDELHELAHGMLPTVLTRGGLRDAVGALAERAPVPVGVDVPAERLPAPIEATAYFVIAEALTNVAKHSRARRATVTAHLAGGALEIAVADDGIGGATPGGRGLLGLADRLATLDGQMRVETPPGGGTLVAATIPL
jgi:signal transduction histidine kinase